MHRHFRIKLPKGELCAKTLVPETTPPGTPWMVFLHEALGCIRLWRDVPKRLVAATGLPALVYERFGSGQSSPIPRRRTSSYLHEEALDILPKVLGYCGIEKCVPIGHSDGGSMALLFAARHSEKVLGVVAEAAHVFVEPETLAGIREARVAYLETDLKARLARYHGSQTDALFWAWQDIWLTPAFEAWNIESALRQIEAPTLVIQGEEDAFGTAAQVRAIETGVAGLCRCWLVPDCGHEPHRQAGEQVVPEIGRFINGLSR